MTPEVNHNPEVEARRHGDGLSAPQCEVPNLVATSSRRPEDGASALPQRPGKAKRTFTPANILKTVVNCALSFPIILRSVVRPKTSRRLREKVMLGVTAINDCRYCAWGHSHWAISQGVSLEEVNQILGSQNGSFTASDPAEAAAILFGQQYAEQFNELDSESVKNLRKFFRPAEVREIVAYVCFITFTNLSGNTVDALLERIRGKGRRITAIEAAVGAVLALPLLVLVLLVKAGKLIGRDKRRAKRHGASQAVRLESGSACTESKAEFSKADPEGESSEKN